METIRGRTARRKDLHHIQLESFDNFEVREYVAPIFLNADLLKLRCMRCYIPTLPKRHISHRYIIKMLHPSEPVTSILLLL